MVNCKLPIETLLEKRNDLMLKMKEIENSDELPAIKAYKADNMLREILEIDMCLYMKGYEDEILYDKEVIELYKNLKKYELFTHLDESDIIMGINNRDLIY